MLDAFDEKLEAPATPQGALIAENQTGPVGSGTDCCVIALLDFESEPWLPHLYEGARSSAPLPRGVVRIPGGLSAGQSLQ